MNFVTFSSLPDFIENLHNLLGVMGSLDEVVFSEINQTKISTTVNSLDVYYRYPLKSDYS